MMTNATPGPISDLLLSIADDKLILGHRNSDWTGLGPILEEDIAFSSLAQDEMAHASAIYELAGGLLDQDPDELAFGRSAAAFRCAQIVEFPDDFDWATALARRMFCNHFDRLRIGRLTVSSWGELSALAKRMEAEQQIQVEHIDSWVVRLGRGGEESKTKMQRAIDALAGPAAGLFEPVDGQEDLVESGVYPGDDAAMFAEWKRGVNAVVARAGLSVSLPSEVEAGDPGGRRGVHTDQLSVLLEEMTEVYRIEPGAKW